MKKNYSITREQVINHLEDIYNSNPSKIIDLYNELVPSHEPTTYTTLMGYDSPIYNTVDFINEIIPSMEPKIAFCVAALGDFSYSDTYCRYNLDGKLISFDDEDIRKEIPLNSLAFAIHYENKGDSVQIENILKKYL